MTAGDDDGNVGGEAAVGSDQLDRGQSGIWGRVVDARTGSPLVGAAVEVTSAEPGTPSAALAAMTDGGGGYAWPTDVGRWTVRVSASGFETQTRTVTVAADAHVQVDVELEPVA